MREWVVILLSCWVALSFAASDQTVPVQSFESVDSPAQSAKPAPKSVSETTKTKPAATVSSEKVLQAQLTQFNQNFLQFQQKVDSQLRVLTNQQMQQAASLDRLEKALTLLNQEVSKLSQKSVPIGLNPAVSPEPVNKKPSWFAFWEKHLGRYGVIAIMLAILVVLFFLLRWIWVKRDSESSKPKSDDSDSDYDYMGSEESIPAKLNLARAYIKMEKIQDAKTLLKEVIEKGNEQQQKSAKDLLKQCQ